MVWLFAIVTDRHSWLNWLFTAKRRHLLVILNYMVTSNHIHLLLADDGDRDVIPKSMQLVAGRTGIDIAAIEAALDPLGLSEVSS